MIKEFKEFIMRGNVLDLAVGVVIGSAFTAIVTKVVDGLITPIVSLVFLTLTGKENADNALSALDFQIRGVTFSVGSVISAIITFLITAFVLFLIVRSANKWRDRRKTEPEEKDTTLSTEEYLEQIRDLLASSAESKNKK